MRNNRGPRHQPCGTTTLIPSIDVSTPLTLDYCFRLKKIGAMVVPAAAEDHSTLAPQVFRDLIHCTSHQCFLPSMSQKSEDVKTKNGQGKSNHNHPCVDVVGWQRVFEIGQ